VLGGIERLIGPVVLPVFLNSRVLVGNVGVGKSLGEILIKRG